jgi:acetyltransferase-like isoleucine patch superfamily enzyme
MTIFYQVRGLRKLTLITQNFIFNLIYSKKLGRKIIIFGFPLIIAHKHSTIKVGEDVIFCSSSYFNEPGINHPVVIRLLSKDSKLTLGNRVGISGGGICVQTEVYLGNDVIMGSNAFITDTDFHTVTAQNRRDEKENVKSEKVIINDNVFIGMNSLILKGVIIGENSIVAAGSVVTKNIPANQIWGGNPAKFIKEL